VLFRFKQQIVGFI